MKITVVGAGYVGLNTAVALAYLSHQVTCVEQSRGKLDFLLRYQAPFLENGLAELLADHNVQSRLQFTAEGCYSFSQSDVIMIAVGTPSSSNGKAHLSQVESAAVEIAEHLAPNQTVTIAVKSTVPVGTSLRVQHLVTRSLQKRGIPSHPQFASNPEFLAEGQAIYDTFYPDRILVGADSTAAAETLKLLYEPILSRHFEAPGFLGKHPDKALPTFLAVSPRSAELTKYASNAFLATKISFINELAGLSEKFGADITEIAKGMGLDPRIGPSFLRAGAGWGGSCFPKDTRALLSMAQEFGYSMPIVQAAIEVNQRQRSLIIDKLQGALHGLRGRRIGILGLAFKPGTDDIREAPSLEIIQLLLDRDAYVWVHDPQAAPSFRQTSLSEQVVICEDPTQCASGCDALLLLTEWKEYLELDWQGIHKAMAGNVLVDARHVLDWTTLKAMGFQVYGVGR